MAEVRPLIKVIRTVGLLEADETQVRHIHTKIAGWVEKAHINYTGQLVEKGKPLAAIYSPELVSTQQEYLLALKARSYLEKSPFGEISSGAHSLLESTRTRLLYWDITPQQIKELEERGEPKKTLTLHSPITGFVTVKEVYEGKYVMPEMELYTVTDLSHCGSMPTFMNMRCPWCGWGRRRPVPFLIIRKRSLGDRSPTFIPIWRKRPAPTKCAWSSLTRATSSSPGCMPTLNSKWISGSAWPYPRRR